MATYILTAAQLNNRILNSFSIPAASTAPINTVAPVISGTQRVDSTLSTTNGTWTGIPIITFTYQWKKNGSNIIGATSSTYVLVAGDFGVSTTIQCVVTGTDSSGNSSANSNILTGIDNALPVVSDSNAQAFVNAAVITDTTQANAVNNLVIGLKADGLWTNMTAIYPFVGGTASTHKWNLRNTATNQLTFFGGFTHNANGVTGNLNAYATTNIYNSATLGIYSRSSNPSGAFVGKRKANEPAEGSQYDITESSLFGYVYNGNIGQYGLGASPYNKFYNVSNGVTGAANEVKVYRNGTNVVLSSEALSTPPSSVNEYYLFANPNTITFDENGTTRIDVYNHSDANIALALFSNTTLDATQNTNLNTRIQTFQTALSRQV